MSFENSKETRYAIVSGGSATNSLVNTFGSLSNCVSYLIPVSDNGGSTAEIIRVIGGPGIGDIRSRLTRLIPNSSRVNALKILFSYRLPNDQYHAKHEWNEIIEGSHSLWDDVDPSSRELVRSFLIHVHVEICKRTRPGREFRFDLASVGNLFLTGARLFTGSLASSIELFARICLVNPSISVIAALNTNFSHHIAASLMNGEIIIGQSQISHPTSFSASNAESEHLNKPLLIPIRELTPVLVENNTLSTQNDNDYIFKKTHKQRIIKNIDDEDYYLSNTLPSLRQSQLHFTKSEKTIPPLPSPIKRIYYINSYGHEIHPRASTLVTNTLQNTDILVYSIGSLYTSIMPVIILKGFADAIKPIKKKVLLLNNSNDHETSGPNGSVMDGYDFVKAIVVGCVYSSQDFTNDENEKSVLKDLECQDRENLNCFVEDLLNWSQFITDVIYINDPKCPYVDVKKLNQRGINCIPVCKTSHDSSNFPIYDHVELETIFRNLTLSVV